MRITLAAALLAASVGGAQAHDWYPYECCSDQDCRELPAGWPKATATGWQVPSGDVIPWNDTRLRKTPPDQDGAHWCTERGAEDGRTLCLFVPPMGM